MFPEVEPGDWIGVSMVNQRTKTMAAISVAFSMLFLGGSSVTAAPSGAGGWVSADIPELESIVDPDGDGYWGTDYVEMLPGIGTSNGSPVSAAGICYAARDQLRDAEVTWEREDPSSYAPASYAIDIVQDEACRELRDDLLRTLWSEQDYPAGFDCARAYTPGIGPARGFSVLPFSVCYGTDQGRCDVYLRHLGAVCLDGLNPDN